MLTYCQLIPELFAKGHMQCLAQSKQQANWLWKETQSLNISYYRKTSNISRTLVGNKIVDNSDAVGASPVGAAPTTSSFST